MPKKILVVAAHPDDEILGAGGTLINHARAGDEVSALILGEGMLAREGAERRELDGLRQDSLEAGKIIGFKNTYFSDFQDNSFDSAPLLKIVKVVEKHINEIKPDIIYTHHEYDLNIDHRLACAAVLTASRPCNENCPAEIYTFETLSSTEWQSKNSKQFQPNVYINIQDSIEQKLDALKQYKTEMRPYPHSRSEQGVKILAQYRGLESGLFFAEAFCLIRKIYK